MTKIFRYNWNSQLPKLEHYFLSKNTTAYGIPATLVIFAVGEFFVDQFIESISCFVGQIFAPG